MQGILEAISEFNSAVKSFVWDKVGIWALLVVGILISVCIGFFQFTHIKLWWKNTACSLFAKNKKSSDEKNISQFQALCTALAATIGTGNIAGVSAAVVLGGPGAVFWMWIAAFLGMATGYAENVLGIYFRRRNADGEWIGGAMYYLRDGLGGKKHCCKLGRVLAALFAAFTVLASFGIGNMGQINKITANLEAVFFKNAELGTVAGIPLIGIILGGVLAVVCGLIILGGIKRIAAFAEKTVPFMAVMYILGALILCAINYNRLGAAFASIFRFAFTGRAAIGGAFGATFKYALVQGCKRGTFSNEAGLGSSVMVHSSSDVCEPVQQGMWGIFQVFFDTIVVCSVTAVVVLTSGKINLETGYAAAGTDDATLVAAAFGEKFGFFGEAFVAISVTMFAFTTVIGWSQYGSRAFEYLFGSRAARGYRIVFVAATVSGAVITSSLAWDISDTFNGLMMLPNLIGITALCPLVRKITRNYLNRRVKGIIQRPLLSVNPEIQQDMALRIEDENADF